MNERLIYFLHKNADSLMENWQKLLKTAWLNRVTADTLSSNSRSPRTPSSCACGSIKLEEMLKELVTRYYSDLLLRLHSEDHPPIGDEEFEHHNPQGTRVTLGFLLETLLAGENVFSKRLLLEMDSTFSGMENLNAFHKISLALRAVFQSYSQKFCNECVSCLAAAIHHVAEKTQSHPSKGKAYDRFPYAD